MSHPSLTAPPTLHLVIDEDGRPARYGVMAAMLAAALSAQPNEKDDADKRSNAEVRSGTRTGTMASPTIGFGHLSFAFDTTQYADAVQHVALSGDLLPSGLVWYERLTGHPAPQPRALTQWLATWFDEDPQGTAIDLVRDGVIAIHPRLNAAADDLASLIVAAHSAMRRIDGVLRCYRVVETHVGRETGWALAEIDHSDASLSLWQSIGASAEATKTGVAASPRPNAELAAPAWIAQQDRYGRWQRILPGSASTQAVDSDSTLTIALIGTEAEQFDGYPGTLAALGDAADALGVTLDVHFVSPHDASALDAALNDLRIAAHPARLQGVVLPGGADMGRVAGQIAAATFGWAHRLPTLGLCLGMQTMATAALQRATGRRDITLMELAPDTTLPSFVRNADHGHRLGLQAVFADEAAAIGTAIRCNHRFRLNPALHATLNAADLDITAWDASRSIVDGIAAAPRAAHPFYAGAQGHPELMSTPQTPHPLILAWLQAIRAASAAA